MLARRQQNPAASATVIRSFTAFSTAFNLCSSFWLKSITPFIGQGWQSSVAVRGWHYYAASSAHYPRFAPTLLRNV